MSQVRETGRAAAETGIPVMNASTAMQAAPGPGAVKAVSVMALTCGVPFVVIRKEPAEPAAKVAAPVLVMEGAVVDPLPV